ncbi:VOC family protein [Aquibacillus albus]|uniref:Lactoylglutathione lyase n=1 Tax=Aquibacillus albus TaxID=1168171 RepID=A0ABS2N474_9BACI|nr:putative lactoylglutathione lyase [Aquibacillus albus]
MQKDLLSGIGIFIPVSDLETSTNWYCEMLGFEVFIDDTPKANSLKIWDGVVTFCLVKSYDFNQPEFPKNDYNVDHYMNFHTGNIQALHQKLLEKGANVGDIHEFYGMKGFALYDPDNNRFSVIE